MTDWFFPVSKIAWLIASPDVLFVLLFVFACLLLFRGREVAARRLLFVLCIVVAALTLFPVGAWMMYPLENRFPTNPDIPTNIDGIILLGGSVMPTMSAQWQQLETNEFDDRLHNFLLLARRYPAARLVFTGGNASLDRERLTEAQILRLYLPKLGIGPDRVWWEEQARNTAENASFSKKLVQPVPGSTWLLVTSAFHMPRSVGVFCKNDWPVIAYPVDHHTIPGQTGFYIGFDLLGHVDQFKQALHEWIGLVAYYLSGRIMHVLPGECR